MLTLPEASTTKRLELLVETATSFAAELYKPLVVVPTETEGAAAVPDAKTPEVTVKVVPLTDVKTPDIPVILPN